MKRRVWWISIVALLGVQACMPKHPPKTVIAHFEIDSAFVDYFAEYREILPTERVLCLYGVVRGDTAWLNFIKPAQMRHRTATTAAYDSCPRLKIEGAAQYLGTWHSHKVAGYEHDDLCRFSAVDDASFNSTHGGVLELLSCRGRLMARSKPK